MALNQAGSPNPALGNLRNLLPELEALYRDVHSHPELSMQETRTAALAADKLRAGGFEVTAGVGKTGVAGLLRNGDGPRAAAFGAKRTFDGLAISAKRQNGLGGGIRGERDTQGMRTRRRRAAPCQMATV
jgi:metal-dependent amidase/aminoacylase/carboxypeptidase family protein